MASEEYPSLSYSSGPAQSRSDQWGFKRAAEKATIALWPLAVSRLQHDQNAFIEFREPAGAADRESQRALVWERVG